jgi:hypothetical protein
MFLSSKSKTLKHDDALHSSPQNHPNNTIDNIHPTNPILWHFPTTLRPIPPPNHRPGTKTLSNHQPLSNGRESCRHHRSRQWNRPTIMSRRSFPGCQSHCPGSKRDGIASITSISRRQSDMPTHRPSRFEFRLQSLRSNRIAIPLDRFTRQ